jgi:SSS family solute:Na+ symporter
VILILGGFAITILVLGMVGGDAGAMGGLSILMSELPGHFEMILDRDHPNFGDLPGIWTLLGGLWVLHFSYWGFNQYIIQRALGAESLAEAQKGLAFAALLKFLIPLIVVIPGIAALWLAQNGLQGLSEQALTQKPDSTYGALMALMPVGIRGLIFAALIAAIVSSLASMINSISTIFTMDIYRDYFVKDKDEGHYVWVGRGTAATAMLIALFLAIPLLGGGTSIFQTIQEYTGFVAPGIVATFVLGFFWKRTNTAGAFALLISSVVLAGVLGPIFNPILGFADFDVTNMPFVVRIWFIFLICVLVGVVVSLLTEPPHEDQPVDLSDISFATTTTFKVVAGIAIAILIGLYLMFW